MKKIFVLLCFFIVQIFASQSFCEKMIAKNNTFLNASYAASNSNLLLNTTTGKQVQSDFEDHLAHLDLIINKFPDQASLMRMLKMKAYAGYAYYLFNTKQYNDLQVLSKKEEGLADGINFDQYGTLPCTGRGMGDVQYFDEESESYYTATAEKDVVKFSMNTDQFWALCDSLFPYFVFANYVKGDLEKGDAFFMQCYNHRYFAFGNNGLMKILAKELLTDYRDDKPVTDVLFAAAVVYLRSKDSNTNETYQKAMAILKRDDQFAKKNTKDGYQKLSNATEKSEVYFIAMDALIFQDSENNDDAVDMMKKYFLAEKKTGIYYIKNSDLAKLLYHGKKNSDKLHQAILKDNDPAFMKDLGDHLMPYFKEYDSASGSDVLYDLHLYYTKAGEKSKAKKAFMTIHQSKRGAYKML